MTMVLILGGQGVLVVDGSNLSHLAKSSSKATLSRIKAATPHTDLRHDDSTCSHKWFFQHWLLYLSTAFGRRMAVAFDTPGPTLRMQRNPNYLAKRHRKRNAPTRGKQQPQRHPLHDTASSLGFIVAYPHHGWDADDAIACIVTHLLKDKYHTHNDTAAAHGTAAVHVVVASADEDMCGVVVDDRVTWAQLALPGQPYSPLGLTAWNRRDLQTRLGYDPVLHGDFLAITGKPEAGLGGCGIGARSAKSLLRQHGSVDAVLAAAATGKLAGHAPKVLAALDPPTADANPAVALMLANRTLTTLCFDTGAVLHPSTIAQLDNATSQPYTLPDDGGTPGGLPLCWHHPAAVVRRMAHTSLQCMPALQASVEQAGTPTVAHCASPLGAAIDLGMLDDSTGALKAAGVVLTPWDIQPDGWKAAAALPARGLLRDGVPGCLHPGLRGVLRMLRREMEVVLYKPW